MWRHWVTAQRQLESLRVARLICDQEGIVASPNLLPVAGQGSVSERPDHNATSGYASLRPGGSRSPHRSVGRFGSNLRHEPQAARSAVGRGVRQARPPLARRRHSHELLKVSAATVGRFLADRRGAIGSKRLVELIQRYARTFQFGGSQTGRSPCLASWKQISSAWWREQCAAANFARCGGRHHPTASRSISSGAILVRLAGEIVVVEQGHLRTNSSSSPK